MSMYNLIGYSSNFSDKRDSLCFYSKDEATDFNANIANKFFFFFQKCSIEYKTILLQNTVLDENNLVLKNAAIALP